MPHKPDITDTTYSRLTLADLRNPFRTERETEPNRTTFPQTFNIESLLDPCDVDLASFLQSSNIPFALDALREMETKRSQQ